MTPSPLPTPFGSEPLDEIPLAGAPLVRVLTQLRFEGLAAFARSEPLALFVESLLPKYPLLKEAHETEIVVGPEVVTQQPTTAKIWQLRNDEATWVITVSNGSLSLETSSYDSRSSFVKHFKEIIDTFSETVGKPKPTRLGIRYTNQVAVDALGSVSMDQLVRGDALGGLAIPLSSGAVRRHSLSDSLFGLDDDLLQVRWGLLPAGALFDPGLRAMAGESWTLDLDSFTSSRIEADALAISKRVETLAERAYRMFRWLVTDHFLERFQEG